MGKYKKRSVVVEAVQFDPGKEWPICVIPWSQGNVAPKDMSQGYIDSPGGMVHVLAGDWIITDDQGRYSTCKPDVFAASYDPVEAKESGDRHLELDRITATGIRFECKYDLGSYLATVEDLKHKHRAYDFKTVAETIEWIITMAKTCPSYKDNVVG